MQTAQIGFFTGATPVDGQTNFGGRSANAFDANSDTWAEGYYETPAAGLITAISFSAKATGLASGEDVTIAVRINDTTDIASSTEARFDVAFETWTVTGLSTLLAAGDKIALKVVHPTYVTNPTVATASAVIFLGSEV